MYIVASSIHYQHFIFYECFTYNHQSLRTTLKTPTVSQSDVEVIIHLFLEYGVKSFSMLEGMFAFILYDMESNIVYVCRDPFGIKYVGLFTI